MVGMRRKATMLVVAACTEFTSLILLRFVEERQRGLGPRESMDVAASRTGRAFIVSGLTAISGVAVLSFSSLPLLRDFGRIVGMNVAVALVSALVVLPPMLVWAEGRGWVRAVRSLGGECMGRDRCRVADTRPACAVSCLKIFGASPEPGGSWVLTILCRQRHPAAGSLGDHGPRSANRRCIT